MKPKRTQFEECMFKAEKKLKDAGSALNTTKSLYENGHVKEAYEAAFHFAEECEKLTLLARVLPAYTGNPHAAYMTDSMMLEQMPIKIEITKKNWFKIKIPALLPKKEKGSADYIRSSLYAAMRRYFYGKPPLYYPNSVIVFNHIYNRKRPERSYRDHDNIELNMIVDVLALYLLKDDMPAICSHYYFSSVGDEDATEIFVIPQTSFAEFLDVVKTAKTEVISDDGKPP